MVLWTRIITIYLIEVLLPRIAVSQCTLDGQTYAVGETWNPFLPPFGAMECVNCTCLSSGNVSCENKECPKPDCKEPKHGQGKCCPVCDVDSADETTGEPKIGCKFKGEQREDGEMFPSTKTGLQPKRDNQCVMCVCTSGTVLCYLKTCATLKCKKTVQAADDCCPQCADSSFSEEEERVFENIPDNFTESDCADSSRLHPNGTEWHPIIGPFGQMKCIICKCKNGNIDCERVKCTPEKELPCRKPKFIADSCCKSCPKKSSKKSDKGKKKSCRNGKNKRRNRKNKRRKNGCKKGKFGKLQVIISSQPFHTVCLPRRTDRLIYKYNTSDSLVIAFDIIESGKVELYRWTTAKGRIIDKKIEENISTEFRTRVDRAQIIGAANEKEYKRFKRKLQRQMKKCKTCRLKAVYNVLKRLRVKKVKFNKDCPTKKRG